MKLSPAISVLVTAYNHEDYVEQALDSVACQTYRDFEVIVTDDCSNDRSAEVIRAWVRRTGFPLTFIANDRNLGICAVRNNALDIARGRFVCSLAADDWYEPDRLKRQIEFFSPLSDHVGFIYSDARACMPDGSELHSSWLLATLSDRQPPEGRIFSQLLRESFIPSPAVMVRRSALQTVGRYDESLVYEDFDMWLRITDRFEVRHHPVVVTNIRELPTSMSRSPAMSARMAASRARVLLKWTGHDQATDEAIADRLRPMVSMVSPLDRRLARQMLVAVRSVPLSRSQRATAALLMVPGGARIVRMTRVMRRVARR